jgi:cyclophilin family peptidyl-prolyl cis-trans isomerase
LEYPSSAFLLDLKTNFGNLKFNLESQFAPKNIENLVRLVDREYYKGTSFHRIAKHPEFGIIQAGDRENSDGSGGQSSYFIDKNNENHLPDEVWKIEPEITPKWNRLLTSQNS